MAAAVGDRAMVSLLGVGYAPLPEAGHSVRLSAAASALIGDPTFISRGAHVAIGGSVRGAAQKGLPNGAAIDVIYPVIGRSAENYPHVHAWSFVGREAYDSDAQATQFNVPITGTQGLELIVRRVGPIAENAAEGALPETHLKFSVGTESNQFKLQRGVYVIAFRETGNETVPAWSAHSVSENNGLLTVDTTAFTHAVMTIDYAN